MKKSILMTAILLSASAFAYGAQADTKIANEFVQKAAISGKFEIESSKLALKRSTDAEVKAFAQKMIDDHTKADKELKATLKTTEIDPLTVPKTLDEKHQKKLDKLKEAKTEDFDKDYLDAQKDAHDEAVELFEDYSEKGDNDALKAFAAKTLPTLKSHHENVDTLEDRHDDHAAK